MTTPLLYLRCLEIGLTMSDLAELDLGFVYDMITEKANDGAEYEIIATQDDFDRF